MSYNVDSHVVGEVFTFRNESSPNDTGNRKGISEEKEFLIFIYSAKL